MGRKTGRNLNPADQYRKEQHKKEIKKNKQDRKKVRELGSAIKDTTTEVELAQYEELEKNGRLDKDGIKKLAELRERMAKIIEIKKAHGIKIKSKKIEPEKPAPITEPARDPTRSIYYDPVLNPYGAPPPGQPYLEYPPEVPFNQEYPPGVATPLQQPPSGSGAEQEDVSDSSDSDSSSDSDLDSDASDSDLGDEDEDFMPPLPEGPAPSKDVQQRHLAPSIPAPVIQPRIQSQQQQQPLLIQGSHYPPTYMRGMHGPPGYDHPMNYQRPPPAQGYPLGYWQQGYGSSPGIWNSNPGAPSGYGGSPPFYGQHPEGGYQSRAYLGEGHVHEDHPPPGMNPRASRPPPSRFVKPQRSSNPQSDPMTGHLPPDEKELNKKRNAEESVVEGESSAVSATHPLPPKPATIVPAVTPKPVVAAGPTSISAEPQLRNLQKELVHLVPSTIMRKRVAQKGKIGRPVNAAPVVADDESSSGSMPSHSNTDDRASGDDGRRESSLGLLLPKINIAPNVPTLNSGPRQIVVNSAPEVAVDRAAKKKAEYDAFLEGLEGDGLL
ncbi:hypothetical protein EMPS_02986 [Entomortierella parvispora]|uniref:Wbp11/ELF5/Saf1 N-terminal domain-containing protein n=1 Tax=Entomortierella parvispora TaxID=205924 RepID=A0A9P3H6H9_9FUNG|nr:hypothetical protein EMPS_02986 [Entomortierella parvispora]